MPTINTVNKIDEIPIKATDLRKIVAKTDNQQIVLDEFNIGKNIICNGSAGTGKSFLLMYAMLESILNKKTKQKKIYIVRSCVPTRDPGFLPGTLEEKNSIYSSPYVDICNELFNTPRSYERLVNEGKIVFISTGFLRSLTIRDAYILGDEMQNFNFCELDTLITRTGKNSKICFAGDYYQSDLEKKDKNGILDFLEILSSEPDFVTVNYTNDDIVRSELVKRYLIRKEQYFRGRK